MTFRFVHAADLHLDTPFEGLRRLSPLVAEAAQDASLDAFDALVALAIDRGAAFVLFAGDIYDGPERGTRAQIRFLRGLERLDERGIQSFVAHGNHDPVVSGWSAIRAWPPRVTVFGHQSVGSVPVEVGGKELATVHGISFGSRAVTENLALRFKRSGAGFQVGLLHCNVGGDPNHDLYSPCTVDDLRDFGLDYWALGHIHARRVLHEGDPWVVYPGNLQGRSPKPSELGPKGAVIVEVDGGTAAAPEFIELDRVRFEQVLVDIAGLGDLADAQKALRDAGRELQQESADRSLLLRGVLTGGGPLHTDLRREGVVKELLRSLRDEEGEVLPFVWWDRVEDVTRPEVDFDTLKGRGDFLAEVLALAEEVDADVEARRVFAEDHLANLPGARLQRLVGELPNAAGEAAWRTAVDRAVDLLLEDGAA